MNLQITKTEARERLKAKVTTGIGIPILLGGVAMLGLRIAYIWTGNEAMKFSWGTEIAPAITLGYVFFSAKDSLIQGMIGLLIPRKK